MHNGLAMSQVRRKQLIGRAALVAWILSGCGAPAKTDTPSTVSELAREIDTASGLDTSRVVVRRVFGPTDLRRLDGFCPAGSVCT